MFIAISIAAYFEAAYTLALLILSCVTSILYVTKFVLSLPPRLTAFSRSFVGAHIIFPLNSELKIFDVSVSETSSPLVVNLICTSLTAA